MLNELLKFSATQERLGKDFGERRIRWQVFFKGSGEYVSLMRLGAEGEGKVYPNCPFSGTATQGVASDFLFEKMEVLLKIDDKGESSTKRANKHQFFISLLKEAGSHSPGLLVLADALSKDEVVSQIRQEFINESRKGKKKADAKLPISETFTLVLEDRCVLDATDWHSWWVAHQQPPAESITKSTTDLMRCIATGDLVEPALRHEKKIEGLKFYGGRGQDGLAVFDKDAFQSYGLKFGSNAAMSADTANRYAAALNTLIKNNSVSIGNVLAIYWFGRALGDKADDPIAIAMADTGADDDVTDGGHAARHLYEAVKKGEREELLNNEYHTLLISGHSGRVMVRHYQTGQLKELAEGVKAWFDDLEICSLAGEGRLAKASGLSRMLEALLPPKRRDQDYGDWIKPVSSLTPNFWQAAFQVLKIPNVVHGNLVQRLVTQWIDLSEAEKLSNKGKQESTLFCSLIYRRMSLLKLFHIRNLGDTHMKSHLNPEHPAPAYQCGRLLALLANLQRVALGDVGAGVVQRYYGAVSQAPALHLGRLVSNAKNHLSKLPADKKPDEKDEAIAGVFGRLGDSIPRTLTLEEQSLFALGYYQQLANLRESEGKKI